MTTSNNWLIDETKPLSEVHIAEMDRELADIGPDDLRGEHNTPTLAVCIHDIIIYDNKKWFGEADIRLDALIVTGYGQGDDPNSFYMPKTATFSRVKDGDRLPIGDGGLLVFHGKVQHFLDIHIMVSRDRKDTDSLAGLLIKSMQSDSVKGAVGSLLTLTGAVPEGETVNAAMSGAAVLGNLAYRLLRNATGNTIGLYRNSHLQYRNGFGLGPHPGPPQRVYHVNDLSFRYEVLDENNKNKSAL